MTPTALIRLLLLSPFLAGAVWAVPVFNDAQEVLAQRPDGTWQEAMIDGKFDGTGYPVQFMEPPYGHEVLPPERIRLHPQKGSLDQQLKTAFPPIPRWTRVRVNKGGAEETAWAVITGLRGIEFKVAWEDGSGRARIRHKDIVEQGGQIDLTERFVWDTLGVIPHAPLGIKHPTDSRCRLSLGYLVQAQDRDDGRWYRARITKKDGCSYRIAWEDGADYEEYRGGDELRTP